MKSAKPGKRISEAEVSNISPFGLWLLVDGKEYFANFKQFPWFMQATVANIVAVRQPHPGHLYWPELDIDLSLESLEFPERFPLVTRVRKQVSGNRTRRKARQPR